MFKINSPGSPDLTEDAAPQDAEPLVGLPSGLTLTGERTLPGIAHENYWVKIDLFTSVRTRS